MKRLLKWLLSLYDEPIHKLKDIMVINQVETTVGESSKDDKVGDIAYLKHGDGEYHMYQIIVIDDEKIILYSQELDGTVILYKNEKVKVMSVNKNTTPCS